MKRLISMTLITTLFAVSPLLGYAEKEKMISPVKSSSYSSGQQQPFTPEQNLMIRQWFSQGQWQLVDRNYPEAATIFNKVLEINPKNVRGLNYLANTYYLHGDYDKALTTIDRAIQLDPVNTKLYYSKAQILDAMQKEAQALDNYLTFITLDPFDTSSLAAQRRADELFKRWEPQFTETQKAYFTGLRYLSMEQPEKALPLLKRFHEMESTNMNANLLLGLAYYQSNQPKEAIQFFEIMTKEQPENPMAYYHLSESYQKDGQSQKAQSAWSRFIQYAPYSNQAKLLNHHHHPLMSE